MTIEMEYIYLVYQSRTLKRGICLWEEIYVTCKKGRYKTKAIEVFLSLCGISLEKNDV